MDPAESNESIEQNYKEVVERINLSAQRSGRVAGSIQLVTVTKGHTLEAVRQVISAGANILGENYVDEAVGKINATSELKCEWHMIGHIQSRKARAVCEHFKYVHSLDSVKLARRLDRFASELDIKLPVLIECNVSGEESKYGWSVWAEPQWPDLLSDVIQITDMPSLQIRGLMTMPPYFLDPERSRPFFVRLRKVQEYLVGNCPTVSWKELSMGMSNDYEIAIEEGATILRIGTAIMGPRSVA